MDWRWTVWLWRLAEAKCELDAITLIQLGSLLQDGSQDLAWDVVDVHVDISPKKE